MVFPSMVLEERDERRYTFKSAGPGWQRPLGTQATRVLGAVNPGPFAHRLVWTMTIVARPFVATV
jgi:hypothetical protein